jgi:hypothetical protein
MPHADDVYTKSFTPSGGVVPSSEIFYTLDRMKVNFLNPKTDCIDGKCNSPEDQANYNSYRDQELLSYEYMTDWLLYIYASESATGLDKYLAFDRTTFVKPFFKEARRKAMVNAVENKIRKIGGGDIEQGKDKVIKRYFLFLDNK